MHWFTHTHYDDRGLLGIEYELRVEFGFADAEPATRFDAGIPAHPYDVRITAATAKVANCGPTIITNEFDLIELNRMLDPSYWNDNHEIKLLSQAFVDEIVNEIAEYMNTKQEAARESADEAKFQAMRDGE